MSQVFAAINHRLSEEYAKIELPSQEAKDRSVCPLHLLPFTTSLLHLATVDWLTDLYLGFACPIGDGGGWLLVSTSLSIYDCPYPPIYIPRLLADARYLQRELSGLKDISMSNTMLETVVKEKSVRRRSPFAVRRASAILSPPSTNSGSGSGSGPSSGTAAGDIASTHATATATASTVSLLSVSSDRTPRSSLSLQTPPVTGDSSTTSLVTSTTELATAAATATNASAGLDISATTAAATAKDVPTSPPAPAPGPGLIITSDEVRSQEAAPSTPSHSSAPLPPLPSPPRASHDTSAVSDGHREVIEVRPGAGEVEGESESAPIPPAKDTTVIAANISSSSSSPPSTPPRQSPS